jgi:hypothetical protein
LRLSFENDVVFGGVAMRCKNLLIFLNGLFGMAAGVAGFAALLLAAVMVSTSTAGAKELTSRLGVGFRNAYAYDIPSVAAVYYPSSDLSVVGALGIDTEENASRSAFSAGVRRIIFKEENMNFHMGGMLTFLSREVAGSSDSGFEMSAVVGGEFFFQGLDSLGLTFETGVGVTNVKKVRFRTLADSPFRAGIIFYF